MTGADYGNATHTGLVFLPMNQAKQAVINNFITQRKRNYHGKNWSR